MSGAEDLRSLLRELRSSARLAARASGAEREEVLARRRELRESLTAIEWDEGTAAALGEHLSHVVARVERLRGATSGRDTASFEILEHRGDLSWLPIGFRDSPQREAVLSLEAEAEILGPAAGELEAEDKGAAKVALEGLREDLERVRGSRLRATLDLLEQEEHPSVEDLREVYFRCDVGGYQELQDEAQSFLQKRIPELPPVEAARTLSEFAAEYEDLAQEEISAQTEFSPGHAADRLEEVRREMQWVRVVLRKARREIDPKDAEQREPRKLASQWSRRLGRSSRRLRRNAQEVRLQARLEGIFGPRQVKLFENLILWLIFAVLGIIVVEAFLPSPDTSVHWHHVHLCLWIADAVICFIFLLEFFVRLALVHGRLSWFLRHFLVDLVPSIPYGLLVHHLVPLDTVRAGRAIRLARLPRLLRYVRVARPFVRFFRFFGFLQRGMDRLVRIHGRLLNRNILLFEPVTIGETLSEQGELKDRLRRARALSREAWRRLSADLSAEVRSERLKSFLARLPRAEHLLALTLEPLTRAEGPGGLVRAEELITTLTGLDPGTVEAEFGQASAQKFVMTLERLDVPLLRHLPGLKQMIFASRKGEPLERVAAAGKALGRYCERLLERVHWISDLSGVITGPQFLDRLGGAMVQATARPAKRLLIFGFGFLLLKGVVDLLGLTFLEGLATWLERVLGTPFLILGAACLIVLVFGSWFRRVAGEATDFYSRTAEAQLINLLKSAKLANLDEDMTHLWDRVLRPESLVMGLPIEARKRHLHELFEMGRYTPGTLRREDRILQLYNDYLDGAIFHISDTKTTSQLLGNLALENIRSDRLGTDRKERKRLGLLDLDKEQSSLRGPYLWFKSITYSVAQWTAKLILDFNRHAIPAEERPNYPEPVREAMDSWLTAKIEGRRPEREKDNNEPGFVTTEFSALHFLTEDEERDGRVAENYGERTLEALRADRRAMIRTIFGTHPFHRMPRADRTLNPFEIYGRYFEGGRILLFPFYLARVLFRIFRWLLRRVKETLREVLKPQTSEKDREVNWASFDVAVRKINRMRKPVYMECARFRALFDPEYMGLTLMQDEESGVEGRTYREDLDGIDARDEEWDPFEEIRAARGNSLRALGNLVDAAGGPEEFIKGLRGEKGGGTWKEAYRAVAIAFSIDYRNAAALATLRRRSRLLIRRAIRKGGRVPGAGWLHRLAWIVIPSRYLRSCQTEFLRRFGPPELDRREWRSVFRAARADWEGLGRLIRLGAELEPGTEPEDAARDVLRDAAKHAVSWSEQLVTLRAVQSLSVLDVRNYRRQVRILGGYGIE